MIMQQKKLGRKTFILMWFEWTSKFWAWRVLSVAIFIWLGLNFTRILPQERILQISFILVAIVLLLFLSGTLWAYLTYRSWRFDFGAHAIEISYGVIERKHISIPYRQIQSIDIVQSVGDRIFGVAKLLLSTAEEIQPESVTPAFPPIDLKLAQEIKNTLLPKIHPVSTSQQSSNQV
ncbi:MAG: PH domain-containing protein [Candidatus Paceibacteria bacterium]